MNSTSPKTKILLENCLRVLRFALKLRYVVIVIFVIVIIVIVY